MQASKRDQSSEEHKLLYPIQKPISNLQVDAAPEIAESPSEGMVDPALIDAQIEAFDANNDAPRRANRMSMSPIMKQILGQQTLDIRQYIHQYKVLQTRNTSRFDYDDVPNHLDILLFGPAGAGKTSLIKTFYRALHEQSSLSDQVESVLTVKDRNSNEGTTHFTKVVVKPEAQ